MRGCMSLEGFFKLIITSYRPIIALLIQKLHAYGLSYVLWEVIRYIKINGASTLVDISRYYEVEKPTITKRVNRLVALGLVKQIPGLDRREKIIQLTEKGEEMYVFCREQISALETQMLKDISPEHKHILFQTLEYVQDYMMKEEIQNEG